MKKIRRVKNIVIFLSLVVCIYIIRALVLYPEVRNAVAHFVMNQHKMW